MSLDQHLEAIASASTEETEILDKILIVDNISKSLIAKQSLNIPYEAPIMSIKQDSHEIEIDSGVKEYVNIENFASEDVKSPIEEEPATETLAAAVANIAIGFESSPNNETKIQSKKKDEESNDLNLVNNEKISEDQETSNTRETSGADSLKDSGITSKSSSDIATTASSFSSNPINASQPKSSQTYSVKWITFNTISLPIILQNENGPCPLISICNVLLLRQQMTLIKNVSQITCNNLMHNLADTLFNVFVPRWTKNGTELPSRQRDSSLNLERNIDDALAIFEKLKMGLDVNVKFSTCREFEYTRELDIFDLFQIGLYHGWLIDPQQVMFYKHFYNKSYNQLVELTFYKDNETSKTTQEGEDESSLIGILADNFLESSASQITYFGLAELHSTVAPGELCVLFRNNHFSTMYKHSKNGKLYLLVTDQGYLTHENIVWETLDNIEGDAVFCDSNFKQVSPIAGEVNDDNFEAIDKNELISDACKSDYLLALSLQEMNNDDVKNKETSHASGDIKQKQHSHPQRLESRLSNEATAPSTSNKRETSSGLAKGSGSVEGEATCEKTVKKDKKDKSSCLIM